MNNIFDIDNLTVNSAYLVLILCAKLNCMYLLKNYSMVWEEATKMKERFLAGNESREPPIGYH